MEFGDLGVEAVVMGDALEGISVVDGGDDFEPPPAVGAFEGIEPPRLRFILHLAQQLRRRGARGALQW